MKITTHIKTIRDRIHNGCGEFDYNHPEYQDMKTAMDALDAIESRLLAADKMAVALEGMYRNEEDFSRMAMEALAEYRKER